MLTIKLYRRIRCEKANYESEWPLSKCRLKKPFKFQDISAIFCITKTVEKSLYRVPYDPRVFSKNGNKRYGVFQFSFAYISAQLI